MRAETPSKATVELPLPHFDYRPREQQLAGIDYQRCSEKALSWKELHHLEPAAADSVRICLLLVDLQLTFCDPVFELYVGNSESGAKQDVDRITSFIYRNLPFLNTIIVTLDTHQPIQIFHPCFWIDSRGEQPLPGTKISAQQVREKAWQVSPALKRLFWERDSIDLNDWALYYTDQLERKGRYHLTIWPYHALLGSLGHALVPRISEACFFHSISRSSPTIFHLKGSDPLTENYSALAPEVATKASPPQSLLHERLRHFDLLIVAGEAKSHCVAWTVRDWLDYSQSIDLSLPSRTYLLEDCCSTVIQPGTEDFTERTTEAFSTFASEGINLVSSDTPIIGWPGIDRYIK